MRLRYDTKLAGRTIGSLRSQAKTAHAGKSNAWLRNQIGRCAVRMVIYEEMILQDPNQLPVLNPGVRRALRVLSQLAKVPAK